MRRISLPALAHHTPLEAFYHWEKTIPNRIYLRQPILGTWHEYSWERAGNEIRRMVSVIQGWGLPPGSHIAIASKNCAHWILADLAIWMSGHVSIPLYPNLSSSTVTTILNHSESKAIFLGKLDDFAPYVEAIPQGMNVITFPYGAPKSLLGWEEAISKASPFTESPSRKSSEVATIIYTSGTTGVPKGVVHKFLSFAFVVNHVLTEFRLGPADRFFSYLPLSHIAERVLIEATGLYAGGSISFAESLDLFTKNLIEVKPTLFLAVPRIWEKFQSGISQKLPPEKLDRLLRIPVLSSFIKRKIQKALGLSSARYYFTGAAPIRPSLLDWFNRLGVEIQEAYGLTENFGYSHLTRKGKRLSGSVGQAWPQVEVKTGPDQEILVKHPALMEGYYKAPELTLDSIRNGFLHTGDQGSIDSNGYLKITGRVKELFKTGKGKYVAPSPIELKLLVNRHLEQACVTGVGLKAPLAILTLSDHGKSVDKPSLKTALNLLLIEVNAQLEAHEELSHLVVVWDSWTPETGFLTPTMKLKRATVDERYGNKLEMWSNTPDPVVIT